MWRDETPPRCCKPGAGGDTDDAHEAADDDVDDSVGDVDE